MNRRYLPLHLRLASASLMLLIASACASSPPAQPTQAVLPAPASPAASSTEQLWQQIQASAADNSCNSDSQCHTIGIGSKACGGPERYLAWSSQRSDGATLQRLVAQHSAARRADDDRQRSLSTCSMVSDPGASCRANRCTLNPAAPFGGQPLAR
ncbi:MAG: hypothetical protein ABW202_08345 [Duganella sp.]